MISEKGHRKLTQKGASSLISKIFQIILAKGVGGVVQDGLLENWIAYLKDDKIKIRYFQSHHGGCEGRLVVTDYTHNDEGEVFFELKTELPTYKIGHWEKTIAELYGKNMKIVQPAMKAFVVYDKRVLILRESMNYESPNRGKWDVAGGRVEFGESCGEGLLREVEEETGLIAKLGKPFSVQQWSPVIKGIENQIVGTFVECFADSPNVVLSKDHDRHEWIDPAHYNKYPLVGELPKAFEDYLNRKAA